MAEYTLPEDPQPVTDHAAEAAELLAHAANSTSPRRGGPVARAHVHALIAVAEALRPPNDVVTLSPDPPREDIALRAWKRVDAVLDMPSLDRNRVILWMKDLAHAITRDKPLRAEQILEESERRDQS